MTYRISKFFYDYLEYKADTIVITTCRTVIPINLTKKY